MHSHSQVISHNVTATTTTYHFDENCDSDEESITAPPYSPLSQISSEEMDLISDPKSTEDQERSTDNRPDEDSISEVSSEVCIYIEPK